MLAIPNTTTTAAYEDAGAAVFPPEAGAGTPYASGFLFVANNAAFVSLLKGQRQGAVSWTPEALVSPTLVPLSTDLSARTPDYIFGIRARDAVPGTHAQVFGALFQQGETNFVPSGQFGGTVATSGSFTPAVTTGQELAYAELQGTIALTNAATEAAPVDIISLGALTYTGATIILEFFAPVGLIGGGVGWQLNFSLWDVADLGRLGQMTNDSATTNHLAPVYLRRKLTPTAASHSYRVRAWLAGGATVGQVQGAAGGAGTLLPGYLRATLA